MLASLSIGFVLVWLATLVWLSTTQGWYWDGQKHTVPGDSRGVRVAARDRFVVSGEYLAAFKSIGSSGTRSNKHMLICLGEKICQDLDKDGEACEFSANFGHAAIMRLARQNKFRALAFVCDHDNPSRQVYQEIISPPAQVYADWDWQRREFDLLQYINTVLTQV
jgi:hypothetical protein